ncbi:MAG: clostripain-related cysteine peptidase, partial [Candidatus Cryptobacteroides sp.]
MMMKSLLKYAGIISATFSVLLFSVSCEKCSQRQYRDSEIQAILMYSAGHNDLNYSLAEDIEELCAGKVPDLAEGNDLFFIFSQLCKTYSTHNVCTHSPVLFRVGKDKYGNVVRDTVLTLSPEEDAADSKTLNKVLTYIKDNYVADSYGIVLSSHGTGYLPANYYSGSDKFENEAYNISSLSFGASRYKNGIREMDITDFADAIPMKMDFILIDACFMGGIEVAYELKDKCERFAGSPTEIMSNGFDYKNMGEYLFIEGKSDIKGICQSYYEFYNSQPGSAKSATVCLVDCNKLYIVAQLCKSIFSKYERGLEAIDKNTIQRYYRGNYHWFYDFLDIIRNCGCTQQEYEWVEEALKQ